MHFAERPSHRTRFAALAAAVVATVTLFFALRPSSEPDGFVRYRCPAHHHHHR
jgi:hypothetical protein